MAAATRMAKVALMLVVLIQIVNVLGVSAARPLFARGAEPRRWLDDGIQMVVDMLGDNKSGNNPPTHCC